MTSISNNYNTKYTTKWKHALALYDVAIYSTMFTCILLDVLNCRLYIRLHGAMDKALDLRIMGREFESRYGQEFFIL